MKKLLSILLALVMCLSLLPAGVFAAEAAGDGAETPVLDGAVEGWWHDSAGWRYVNPDGSCPQNAWQRIGGRWYHFDAAGYMQTGWQKISGRWYYLGTDGAMRTGWQKIDGKWYWFDSDGVMRTGWVSFGGSWYYFDMRSGFMATYWQKIDGKWYWFDADGVMRKGWVQLGSSRYYFDMRSGFMFTDWQEIGGTWYYFDADGVMRTGWQKISGRWYYLGTDGAMRTGWQQIAGKRYYFENYRGYMAAGWVKIDGTWYHFDADGVMQTGWQKISGKWYYLGTDGAMATGWQKIGGAWYWFDGSGAMATGTVTIDGTRHRFSGSGVWLGSGGAADRDAALTAYRKLLEQGTFTGSYGTADKLTRFALYDCNGDGVPELLTYGGFRLSLYKLFTYKDGGVECLMETSALSIYDNGIISTHFPSGAGYWLESYFRMSGAGTLDLQFRYAEWYFDAPSTYSVGENAYDDTAPRVPYSRVEAGLAAVLGSAKTITLTFYDNTAANRSRYLA